MTNNEQSVVLSESKSDVTNQSLFQLSYPLLLNAAIGMVVTLIDTVIISRYSEDAAAAVSMANQILLVAFDFSAIFATGAVVLVSRSLGANEPDRAKEISEAATTGNAMISFVFSAIIFSAAAWLASAINTPREIFADTVTYLRVGAFTILLNGVMMAGTSTLRGYGQTRIILVLGIAAYVTYLLAEVLLIYGWGPIPELGVFGSALATLLVRAVAVIALTVVLYRRLTIRTWALQFSTAIRHLPGLYQISWPAAVDNLAYGFYQMLLVSFIATYSVAMVLARTFTLSLSAFLTVTLMSISQANEVMVGFRFGAGRNADINRCIAHASLVATLITTSCAALLYLFAEPLIGLFTNDVNIHQLATQLLWITIFVQPFSAVNTILFHSLKTTGDVVVPVAVTQIMMWGMSVPIAWWLTMSLQLGVVGLWYVLLLEEALKAIFLGVRWCFWPRMSRETKTPNT
ncbi:MAG: MATE family efflux transporter [Planctomycetota bacterium]